MQSQWKLKIINGPLRGRELKLPEGEISIGSDDSDIAVALEGDQSATLQVNEQGVRLAETGVPLWFDGIPQQESDEFIPGSVIDLAGLCFVVGRSDQELNIEEIPSRRVTRTPRIGSRIYPYAFGLFLLLSGGILYLGWRGLEKPAVPEFNPKAWVAEQSEKPAYKALKLFWTNDGLLTVRGYCQDGSAYQDLLDKLVMLGIHYRNQAVCQQDIVNNVAFILQQNGYSHVSVLSGNKLGTVIISGAIYADKQWEKVSQTISRVRGLKSWEVKSQHDDGLRLLVEMLRSKNLLGKLSVSRSGTMIVITGTLDNDAERVLKEALDQFAIEHPNVLRIIYQNIPIGKSMLGLLPAPIISFGGNNHSPYLILNNGMRVQEGTRLPSGYEVSELGESGIELTKDGQLLHIPLNL
ncbi:type III secretion system inner membrane ring subunit SctD [Dongshaea marina]|uniref:type III secretion system inner membrane ring subunit SctD n=1 Tax=Dongshaea marina TaxID=2047966 RepID=UPI000D3E09E4|nr:type III secretion system inner membrane ring subunit SctD [Dongshaea marina]